MAFADPWILTTPSDTDWASEGDDRIREMKRALDERLGSIIDGWPDGGLTVKTDAIPEGATDGVLATGLKSALPNPPATKFYYATDTKELFVDVDNAWALISGGTSGGNGSGTPSGERFEIAVADYDESAGSGSMSSGQFTAYRALGIHCNINFTAGQAHLILSELGMTATNYFAGMAIQMIPSGGAISPSYFWLAESATSNGTPAEDYVAIHGRRQSDDAVISGWFLLLVTLYVRV